MNRLRNLRDGATFGAISGALGAIIVGVIGSIVVSLVSGQAGVAIGGAMIAAPFYGFLGMIWGTIGGAIGSVIGLDERGGWAKRGMLYSAIGGLVLAWVTLISYLVSFSDEVSPTPIKTAGLVIIMLVAATISGGIGGLICKSIAKTRAGTIRIPTNKEYLTTSMVISFPCILGFILFILNPTYIGRMFLPCSSTGLVSEELCSQPCGWIMIGMAIALVSLAAISLLGNSTLLPEKNNKLIIFLVLILFIFPALFIICLGPATLILLETPGLDQP